MILNMKFSELSQKIDVDFHSLSCSFLANFGEIETITKYVGGGLYEGEYIVTPRTVEQTMPTKEKVMLEDVTIKAIPFYDVSNTSGGSTVYIANEV